MLKIAVSKPDTQPTKPTRIQLDDSDVDKRFQDAMRWHDYLNSTQYEKDYKKSRLPNGAMVGGLFGLGGLGLSKYLTNKYNLTGWKKWLSHGILGGSSALLGAYLGSKMGPSLPDEYRNYYYDQDGTRRS